MGEQQSQTLISKRNNISGEGESCCVPISPLTPLLGSCEWCLGSWETFRGSSRGFSPGEVHSELNQELGLRGLSVCHWPQAFQTGLPAVSVLESLPVCLCWRLTLWLTLSLSLSPTVLRLEKLSQGQSLTLSAYILFLFILPSLFLPSLAPLTPSIQNGSEFTRGFARFLAHSEGTLAVDLRTYAIM